MEEYVSEAFGALREKMQTIAFEQLEKQGKKPVVYNYCDNFDEDWQLYVTKGYPKQYEPYLGYC